MSKKRKNPEKEMEQRKLGNKILELKEEAIREKKHSEWFKSQLKPIN